MHSEQGNFMCSGWEMQSYRLFSSRKVATSGENNDLNSPVCGLQVSNSQSSKTAELKVYILKKGWGGFLRCTFRSLLSKWVEAGTAAGEMLWKMGRLSTDGMVDSSRHEAGLKDYL